MDNMELFSFTPKLLFHSKKNVKKRDIFLNQENEFEELQKEQINACKWLLKFLFEEDEKKLDFTSEYFTDIVKIAINNGFQIMYINKSVDGMLLVDEDCPLYNGYHKIIMIPNNKYTAEINRYIISFLFTYYLVFPKHKQLVYEFSFSKSRYSLITSIAHQLTKRLLMPKRKVKNLISCTGRFRDLSRDQLILILSKKFRVSEGLAKQRVLELGYKRLLKGRCVKNE